MGIRFVITTEDDNTTPEKFAVITTDPYGGGVNALAMTLPPTYYPSEWIDATDIQRCDPEDLVGWFVHAVNGADERFVGPITSIVKEVF